MSRSLLKIRSTGRPRSPAAGFTLTELLVTITIVAILVGLVLGGMRAATRTAKEAKTKATIAKLHGVVMPLYESYRTRRVAIDTTNMPPNVAVAARLQALRDLMRMEMPERITDIRGGIDPMTKISTKTGILQPSANAAYWAMIEAAGGEGKMKNHTAAECLYMIVTVLGGEDARRLFQDDEIGDADGNGLPEFLDGWGNPIRFLRWAPGFNLSDLQPNVPPMTREEAAKKEHDPFDVRRVDPSAWRLVPLIYSAGPDYVLDENSVPQGYGLFYGPYEWNGDTYKADTGARLGEPMPGGGYADNIHNHHVE